MNAIIKSDNTIVNTQPKNGTDFSLEELQQIVGGYIEIVYLLDDYIMVINEEGKLMNLPMNAQATHIYQNHTGCYDTIVGDVLVCKIDRVK